MYPLLHCEERKQEDEAVPAKGQPPRRIRESVVDTASDGAELQCLGAGLLGVQLQDKKEEGRVVD